MSNPMWVAGGKSANPAGRPKNSVRTVKGMVERFVRRNITPNKLQKMFGPLNEKDKIDMLLQLLPYVMAKQSSEGINQEEVEKLHEMLENALKQKEQITGMLVK